MAHQEFVIDEIVSVLQRWHSLEHAKHSQLKLVVVLTLPFLLLHISFGEQKFPQPHRDVCHQEYHGVKAKTEIVIAFLYRLEFDLEEED